MCIVEGKRRVVIVNVSHFQKNVIMDRILPFFTFQSQTISDTKSLYFHEGKKGRIRVTKTAGDSTKNKYSEMFVNMTEDFSQKALV